MYTKARCLKILGYNTYRHGHFEPLWWSLQKVFKIYENITKRDLDINPEWIEFVVKSFYLFSFKVLIKILNAKIFILII